MQRRATPETRFAPLVLATATWPPSNFILSCLIETHCTFAMATPSGAVNKTTPGNTSTPHYLQFSSPIPPRSVQSPAALRAQQTAKSPHAPNSTSATMAATAASTGAQSHPSVDSTLLSASGHLLRSSPAGALANFDSPATMLHSLSGMGFAPDASAGAGARSLTRSARGSDEERRKKLEAIVDTLRTSFPVRLSPEGIEIVGQRLAMDVVLDPPKQRRKDGSRDCYLGGQTIVIEVLPLLVYGPGLTGADWL
jgi:hypothetical protein